MILSLDIGSSSARALLFDTQGQAVDGTLAREEYQPTTSTDGAVELDPDRLLETVWGLIDRVLAQPGASAGRIAAVAMDTFVTSTLALDANGKPVIQLLTYADTRSEPDAEALRRRLDEAAFSQRTGVPFHPGYLPARIAWLTRTNPTAFARVRRWVTLGEYMAQRLFGEMAVSLSAAAWTGMEDLRRCAWDEALLAALSISTEQLSPLVDLDYTWRSLRPEFAARWPALQSAAWFPAVGDGAASNIGTGCTTPGQVAVVMGTSSAVRVALDGPVPEIPAGLWCYRIDAHRPLLGGAMNEGGVIFAWARRFFNWQGQPDLEKGVAALPPDGHGLTFLPLLAGERSPGWRGDARGGIYGLSLATTPLEVLRAGMEGVCYRIAGIYTRLRPTLPGDPLIVASGGALQASPTWAQILADVLGRPVIVSAEPEPSARGSALLAAQSLDLLSALHPAVPTDGQHFEPHVAQHTIYQRAILRQQDFYDKMVSGKEKKN
ncbi:MAG TPA: gluconokinase [Anaerolineaceae bacterium]